MRKSIVKVYLESFKRIPSHMELAIFLIVNRLSLQLNAITPTEIGCYPPNILHDFKSNEKPQ